MCSRRWRPTVVSITALDAETVQALRRPLRQALASRPSLSHIKTVLATEARQHGFTLLYTNKDQSSVIFKSELDDLKDRYLERLAGVPLLYPRAGRCAAVCGAHGCRQGRDAVQSALLSGSSSRRGVRLWPGGHDHAVREGWSWQGLSTAFTLSCSRLPTAQACRWGSGMSPPGPAAAGRPQEVLWSLMGPRTNWI